MCDCPQSALQTLLQNVNSIWSKEELPDQWKESIIAPVYKNCSTVVIIGEYRCCQLQYCIQYPSLKFKSIRG
jgi:hypothetical protein